MKTLILGAGLSGLSVASNLSLNYQVIEKSDKCGGLCRSSRVDGFTFDRAGHVLHFKDKANLRYVEKSLGLKLKAYGRDSGVWVGDRIIDYPYQHNFLDTGSSVADECLEGFKDALRNRRVRRPKNFRSWIIDNFGNGIARHFMFPYNDKFWLFPLNDMDSSWADALVPVPLLSDLETQRSRTGVGYNARFWYPVSGGIQSLIGVLEKRVRNIRRRCKAKEIDLVKKRLSLMTAQRHVLKT